METFTYRNLCVVAGVLSATLFVFLLTAPDLIAQLFGIDGGTSFEFISRRAAILFLGTATMFCAARTAGHSAARQAILLGYAVAMGGLAILGFVEFLRGAAGVGILIAVFGELFITSWALFVWRKSDS